jgi:hypothetical protein
MGLAKNKSQKFEKQLTPYQTLELEKSVHCTTAIYFTKVAGGRLARCILSPLFTAAWPPTVN